MYLVESLKKDKISQHLVVIACSDSCPMMLPVRRLSRCAKHATKMMEGCISDSAPWAPILALAESLTTPTTAEAVSVDSPPDGSGRAQSPVSTPLAISDSSSCCTRASYSNTNVMSVVLRKSAALRPSAETTLLHRTPMSLRRSRLFHPTMYMAMLQPLR